MGTQWNSVSCLATFPSSWDTGDDNIVTSLESREAATSLQGEMSMRRSDLICTACTFSSHAAFGWGDLAIVFECWWWSDEHLCFMSHDMNWYWMRYNDVIRKVTLSFTPYPLCFDPLSPLFQWYPQSKEILLNLSVNCWNSGFNAQGSRVIIVVVQVGAVKIYVAAVEALRKKERRDETQLTTKIGGKTRWGSTCFVL
jgi:hypothetical protein